MTFDNFKPTRSARQITMVVLLRNEGPELAGYTQDRDFLPMIDAMRAGWQEVITIWTGAMIHHRRLERVRRQER